VLTRRSGEARRRSKAMGGSPAQAIPHQRAFRPIHLQPDMPKKGRRAYLDARVVVTPDHTFFAMPVAPLVKKHALNAVTAVLFLLASWRLWWQPELPAVLAFIFGGVLLAVIDWKYHRLPTKLVYLTLLGVLIGLGLASLIQWDWHPGATALLGAAIYAGA